MDFLPSSKKGVIMVGIAPSVSCFLAAMVDDRRPRKKDGAALAKEKRLLEGAEMME